MVYRFCSSRLVNASVGDKNQLAPTRVRGGRLTPRDRVPGGTPAFTANILHEDIILRIAGEDVIERVKRSNSTYSAVTRQRPSGGP